MGSNGGVDTRTPESAENDARHTIDRQMPNLSQIPCYSLNERTRKAGRTVRSGSPSIMHPRSAAQRTASHAVASGSPFTAVEAGRLRCTSAASFPSLWVTRPCADAWRRNTLASQRPCRLHADATCMPMGAPPSLATALPRCAPRRARPASHQGGHRVRAHFGQLSSPMHLPN